MSKTAIEYFFTGSTTSGYDSTKLSLGPLMWQNSGALPSDKWVGPYPIQIGRSMEASTAIPAVYPHAISYSNNLDYVFYADLAAAAATRRIVMYSYNKSTQVFNNEGFITLVYPTATAHTIRGFRMCYYSMSDGFAMVTGTAVTMSVDATPYTYRFATGSRIGFGSTTSSEITNWYQVSQISGNDTSITLQTPYTAAAYSGNYILEELRAITLTTNATLANGGLYVAKGLNLDLFTPMGTYVIPAATTIDNLRAVYWCADAAAILNGTGSGLGLSDMQSFYSHSVYALDGATTIAKIYKYNIKAPLTNLAAGKSTGAFLYSTATQSVTGNISQLNNMRYGTLAHGPGSGSPSLYFVTTNRIYRCDETLITSQSLNFLSDVMLEIPPGSTNTFAASAVMASIEIANSIDRLIIGTTSATSLRNYITRYRTDSGQMDHIIGLDMKQIDQSTADSETVPMPMNNLITGMSFYVNNGVLYMTKSGITAILNQQYVVPIGADWQYASTTNCRIITPEISTPGAEKFYSVYFDDATWLGGVNLGMPTEPCRVYARTSGITDNTGNWTLINRAGDLNTFDGANSIQFMFEFRLIGLTCIPDRVYSMTVLYEAGDTDSHYTPSTGKSVVANRIFAYRQASEWPGNIPDMRIRLYNVATEGVILDDDTSAGATGSLGYWDCSTDSGSTWQAWNVTSGAIGNYVRYRASSLPDSTTIRSLLTQL